MLTEKSSPLVIWLEHVLRKPKEDTIHNIDAIVLAMYDPKLKTKLDILQFCCFGVKYNIYRACLAMFSKSP